jgi:phosphodiesterase/alkaline phosphatase D-like protein
MSNEKNLPNLLGPFVGGITDSSVKIWLHLSGLELTEVASVYVTLQEENIESSVIQSASIDLTEESLRVGIAEFKSLKPDSLYFYRLWNDENHSLALDLQGLAVEDLYFRTLLEKGYNQQLDFLLMSCHNPETAKNDDFEGFAVWRQMPEIIKKNVNVRFAILAGDQIYGDEVEAQILGEPILRKSQELYLSVYRKFWNNIYYRKVLCSLPAVLMWDDHDITDGWGSREDSYVDGKSTAFTPEWKDLFAAASSVFKRMQAQRNPEPLSKDFATGFDTCFKIGRAGFAVADLRSNRNVRQRQVWLPEQLDAIRKWVDANKPDIDTFFFVSTVVFSHGAPQVDRSILKYWFYILDIANWFGRFRIFKKRSQQFNESVGDLRDDINDSWGSDVNAEEADRVLDFLFSVQNPPGDENPVNVVILSGDIHTPGYSTIYSSDPSHKKRAAIPHIVATPVAYKPFSWIGEAIFRHLTRNISLGEKNMYTAQVSHHFCYRNVVVVSLRNYQQDESHLKVKYYLEGYPEPQVMLFDLNHGSRREAIEWDKLETEQPVMESLPLT